MTTSRNWQRLTLLSVFAAILVTTWSIGSNASTLAPSGQAVIQGAHKYPSQVFIIRHGEKPDDVQDLNLTSRGATKAAALPSLFLIPPLFPKKPAPFATPDFLFATHKSKKSERPVQTVTPLAKALGGMEIEHKHADDDYPEVTLGVATARRRRLVEASWVVQGDRTAQ